MEPLVPRDQYERTAAIARQFQEGAGAGLQAELERLAEEAGPQSSWLSGFWDTMYLEIRDSLVIGVSPFLAIKDDPFRRNQRARDALFAARVGAL